MPDSFATRTVVVPHHAEPELYRALLDMRSAVNSLLPDWRAHPDESRFDTSKRSYPTLRARYPHLASNWCVSAVNEAIAVLNAWDRSVRRARREDPARFERMRHTGPRRKQLKVSLHRNLFAYRNGRLRITIHRDRHLSIDLAALRNPLFWRYGAASEWDFGLTVRPKHLLFHFRVPREVGPARQAAGIDLNFASAIVATTDGRLEAVDLRPILRIQDRMARKHAAINRHISKDLRHQRAVHRRYGRRGRRRTDAELHRVSNELVRGLGDRAVVVEELTGLTRGTRLRAHHSAMSRARLSRWTHARLVSMLAYKLATPMVRVNPEGTSQECPRCGGHTALPREEEGQGGAIGRSTRMTRRTVCENCGSNWHRDGAAAIAILARGRSVLRGVTVPPSARDALLKAAAWRSEGESLPGLVAEPMKGDDAKPGPLPLRGRVVG